MLKPYYHNPFGLTQKGYNNLTTSLGSAGAKKYQYNGKELQDELGLNLYDYGARFYDPALGRFTTIDPLAKKYVFQSPYVYAANDPIRLIDANGKGPLDNLITNLVISLVTKTAPSFNNFWNKEASYMSQTHDNNGNYHSANAFSAATHGMTANKIITDISETVKPITDNMDITAGLHDEVNISKSLKVGLGMEMSLINGSKNIGVGFPGVSAQLDTNKNNKVALTGTVLNKSISVGQFKPKQYNVNIPIGIGTFKMDTKGIKKEALSPTYLMNMINTEKSYNGGGLKLKYYQGER